MRKRKNRRWMWLLGVLLVGGVVGAGVGYEKPAILGHSAKDQVKPQLSASPNPTPKPREAIAFHMNDLDHGWIRYADGGVQTTSDGGEHWQWQEASGQESVGADGNSIWKPFLLTELPSPTMLEYDATTYTPQQVQFLTERIGWALLDPKAVQAIQSPYLVTIDGGKTWSKAVSAAEEQAFAQEKQRQQALQQEAALYPSPEVAKQAILAQQVLIPAVASPGDVVLLREAKSGEVKWQGKTYTLLPFGAGYFAYLPLPMSIKPGAYPVGDLTLTIQTKKFDTQYLQVSDQLESMRQDETRIDADQKKIDLARSKSQPMFLFGEKPFVQPIEGIVTTPFGYTRYVNGKLDSIHTALDIAAKESTPIKATNDGVVALAEPLYLTGNSIYIDHGMGLFSQYAHLSKILVKAGDKVKQGDVIGLVGTTGFSTGPHLHFTFWANNVPVNPNLFFNTTPFGWLQKNS